MSRLAFSLLLALTTPAFAQDTTDEDATPRRVLYQKETQIDFDAVELDAELVRPSIRYLEDRAAGRFNPLIVLREDFAPEMLRSTNAVR